MASASRYPRFLTFKPGEREAFLRERLGLSADAPLPYTETGRGDYIKSCTFPVTFPDRTEGNCRYQRKAPSWHLFQYTYGDGANLPVQYWNKPLAGYLPTIHAKGRELAEACYQRACRDERERYFQRASFPKDGSRSKRPERSQMTVARARILAGQYALCIRHGDGLIAVSAIFNELTDANDAWRQERDSRLVVACCNRLDRCWELPRYNPLYAEFDPRTEEERGVPSVKGGDR